MSPQAGVETGQPEILAEAKRGNIDAAVVGTQDPRDGHGSAQRHPPQRRRPRRGLRAATADYCRYWNRAMPFMFEREGDFTELLIPANLLADDSVPSRAVKVLTTEVCQDVEVIGWLYQFYISERKDEVFAGFKKNKSRRRRDPRRDPALHPALDRPLPRRELPRPSLDAQPPVVAARRPNGLLHRPGRRGDRLPQDQQPEELKVIDPACGSGHMLTYAFDLLYAIYEEEGYAPSEIPGLILANNLYGAEIDPRAGALAAFALAMKARAKQRTFFNKQVEPQICVIDPISFAADELDFLVTPGGDRHEEITFWNQFAEADTFGSLVRPDAGVTARLAQHFETLDDDGDMLKGDVVERANRVVTQAEYLTSRYAVAIANPPYMGSKNMAAQLAAFAEDHFPGLKGRPLCDVH